MGYTLVDLSEGSVVEDRGGGEVMRSSSRHAREESIEKVVNHCFASDIWTRSSLTSPAPLLRSAVKRPDIIGLQRAQGWRGQAWRALLPESRPICQIVPYLDREALLACSFFMAVLPSLAASRSVLHWWCAAQLPDQGRVLSPTVLPTFRHQRRMADISTESAGRYGHRGSGLIPDLADPSFLSNRDSSQQTTDRCI